MQLIRIISLKEIQWTVSEIITNKQYKDNILIQVYSARMKGMETPPSESTQVELGTTESEPQMA